MKRVLRIVSHAVLVPIIHRQKVFLSLHASIVFEVNSVKKKAEVRRHFAKIVMLADTVLWKVRPIPPIATNVHEENTLMFPVPTIS
jgi:hypothetical protein